MNTRFLPHRLASFRTLPKLERSPFHGEMVAVVPVLALIDLHWVTVVLVSAYLLLAQVVGRGFWIKGEALVTGGIAQFAVLVSIFALITGIFGSLIPGVIGLLVLSAVSLFLQSRSSFGRDHAKSMDCSPQHLGILHVSLLYCGTLVVLGWRSLWFYTAALALSAIGRKFLTRRLSTISTFVIIPTGFLLSAFTIDERGGQFWRSYDQQFRSAIAAGLPRWGYSDFIGATGAQIQYHWLGEAVAGVMARVTPATAIQGVNQLIPALGILVSLSALIRVATRFNFTKAIAGTGAFLALTLNHIFELYSVGSLWGIGLFLLATLSLDELRVRLEEKTDLPWAQLLFAVVIAPLITMTQSTMGILYLACTAMVLVISTLQRPSIFLPAASVVAIQVASLLILRTALLSSDQANPFQPVVSLGNLLQFRGVDIYYGSRTIYVVGVSLLFLFVISQALSGLVFSSTRYDGDRRALWLLGIVAVPSLALVNLFSIGGAAGQQTRFMVPLTSLGSFFSFMLLLRRIHQVWGSRTVRLRLWGFAFVFFVCLTGTIAFAKHFVWNATWSQTRILAVAALIVGTQLILLLLIGIWMRLRARRTLAVLILLSVLSLAITADGEKIRYFVRIHSMTPTSVRSEPFVGDARARTCLDFIKTNTSPEAIIASNWYRIPAPSRDWKYFLVSAVTERRTFVDGAGVSAAYTKVESGLDINNRVAVVDGFADDPTQQSFSALRNANVEYFIVERRGLSTMRTSWEPFATTVISNEVCAVLRLNL